MSTFTKSSDQREENYLWKIAFLWTVLEQLSLQQFSSDEFELPAYGYEDRKRGNVERSEC